MISRIASSAIAVGAAIAAGAVYTRGRLRDAKAPKTVGATSAVTRETPRRTEEAPREIGIVAPEERPSALTLQEIYNRVSFV